jgi:hypothetical protein
MVVLHQQQEIHPQQHEVIQQRGYCGSNPTLVAWELFLMRATFP